MNYEMVRQLERELRDLCSALLRQGTEQDGNWGWPSTRSEIHRIHAQLERRVEPSQGETVATAPAK